MKQKEQNKQRIKDFLYNLGKGKSIYEIQAENEELELIETQSKEDFKDEMF